MMRIFLLSLSLCVLVHPVFAAEVGKCQIPRSDTVVVCKEAGSEKLCFSTPSFGVVEDYIDLSGTVDLSQGLANLTLAVQHLYTGSVQNITAKRCSSCENVGDFCINNSGVFCAKVELDKIGAYSSRLSASFLDNLETRTAKFSKIVEPNLAKIIIEEEPEPLSDEILNSTHINLKVSLLEDCEQCDFIGSSTGAISIKAENKIFSADGQNIVSCETNVEQGGSGRFAIGVPVGNGENEIVLSLCSPAFEACRVIKNIKWGNANIKTGVEIISPLPRPSYSKSEYSNIKLSFRWNNAGDECLSYEYNLEPVADQSEICPVNGLYSIDLNPRKGVNALVVRKGGSSPASWPWFFGWGNIESPFDEKTWTKEKILALHLPKNIILDLAVPKLNEYLKSDKFYDMVLGLGDNLDQEGEADKNDKQKYMPDGCSSGSSSMKIGIAKGLTIGSVEVKNVVFEDNKLSFRVVTDDVNIPIDVETNYGSLPLRIGWRKAAMDLALLTTNNNGEKHLELSGPHSDCDYRKKPYCENKPAILIPANLIGDGKWGQFIHCDEKRGDISGKLKELCHEVENINAQTGLVHDKVLQAINDLIRCTGTSLINDDVELNLTNMIPPVVLSLSNSIEIKSTGIDLSPFGVIGLKEHFLNLAKEFHHPSVGVIKEDVGDISTAGLSLGIPLNSLNRILFGYLANQKNGLSLDVDENFIKEKFDFDFNLECDQFDANNQTNDGDGAPKEQSAFCLIRPRVQEMLGSSLASFGYFEQKQPLLLRVNVSTALPPHISFVEGSLNTIDLAVGGITIDFYPLVIDKQRGVDEFGNLYPMVDADGKPVIADWTFEGREVPIISFGVGIFARVEVSFDGTVVSLRLLSSGTKLFMSSVSGSNATTVPDELLVDTIRGKLVAALDGYTSESAEPLLNKDVGDGYELPDPLTGWYLGWKNSQLKFENGWIKLNNLNLDNRTQTISQNN